MKKMTAEERLAAIERAVEPIMGLQVNDGTQICAACLSAASISTIRAVKPLRDRIVSLERVADAAEELLRREDDFGYVIGTEVARKELILALSEVK